VNAAEPCVQGGFAGGWLCRTDMEDPIQDCGFALEREGGDTAEDESDDEEYEPESDAAEMMRGACGHGFSVVSGSGFSHTGRGMRKKEGTEGLRGGWAKEERRCGGDVGGCDTVTDGIVVSNDLVPPNSHRGALLMSYAHHQ